MTDLAIAGAAVDADGAAPVATPAEELGTLVAWGSAAFYWAESGVNPAVRTYWDAVHYIATSLSVGYANIFPVTPVGKIIGALVMSVGPALSARVLEPAAAGGAGGDGTALIAAKLDAILAELRASRAQQ
jgi:voltage-gated potassium channel